MDFVANTELADVELLVKSIPYTKDNYLTKRLLWLIHDKAYVKGMDEIT